MAVSGQRQLKGTALKLVTVVAVSLSIYHILYVSRILEHLGIYIIAPCHRAATVAFLIILALLVLPMRKGEPRDKVPWYDWLLMLLGAAGPTYLFFFWRENILRLEFAKFYPYEYLMGLFTIVVVLEITRRAVGPIMPLFALLFITYMFTADHFPGVLFAEGASIERAASLLIYSTQGLYGVIMGVGSTIIIMFVIFGAFLFLTPAGRFFLDLPMALVGHVRGGPAKVAVVASGLFGTMSQTVAGNIATTGTFTIPLMRRTGYPPVFAGAAEAVASTGGQIMPPVMGTAAFLMAEWLGISYWSVCVAAFLPAVLYYIALFVMVDGEAQRLGLRGVPRADCPPLIKTVKEGWTSLVPLAVLIFFLAVLQYSPELSVLYALLVLIVINMSRKKTRLGLDKWIAALKNGAINFVTAGVCCATAGVIVGSLTLTQVGIRLTDTIIDISGGYMLPLLVMAAVLCYILGMGMPGVAAYIMVVIFIAPTLLKFGVVPLAAHLFIFYFALTSFITPPVAVAAFVAAAISGASAMRTGFTSMKLGIIAYTVPFMFVYNQALLLQGPPLEIVLAVVTSITGATFLAWGVAGYGLGKANWVQRILFAASGIILIMPGWTTDLIGVAIAGLTLAWQVRNR